MPIYELTKDTLRPAMETQFGNEGLYERQHIQQQLKRNIGVLGEDLLVVAEEFGDWLDSARRIDLLCLDREANLVVVELKRTDDGGHMELQALRYAAMISAMTFEQLLETYVARSLPPLSLEDGRARILDFLAWDDVAEDLFAQTTRIVLASADFSKELTTTVMWLNDNYGLDIRCVRLKPYKLDEMLLLDVQQIIPLPEASAFQTQIGVKKRAERQAHSERHDLRYRFWEELLDHAKQKTALHTGRKPSTDNWINSGIGRTGFALTYSVTQHQGRVELDIAYGAGLAAKNKAAFHALKENQATIERVFGEPLDWQELPERESCRICLKTEGGYRSPQSQWPDIHKCMVDAMIRLDRAMRQHVQALP
ncbi:DUF4268 domain-containing protein [Jeongeupia naejangsanensis]|uniref:DUF4268 domain-containing protein n=1 Tax=Jeongeupia naejangsanensis TaxID=613195 RepID=A0ABS2BLF0_9NEIS|nr:DUF4268 domain-containing protein [Jeongeupia naejangsanensis]MBM3115821.1 DUF4268 domain-containing protein [Jeongeupia naejangsanensis]